MIHSDYPKKYSLIRGNYNFKGNFAKVKDDNVSKEYICTKTTLSIAREIGAVDRLLGPLAIDQKIFS